MDIWGRAFKKRRYPKVKAARPSMFKESSSRRKRVQLERREGETKHGERDSLLPKNVTPTLRVPWDKESPRAVSDSTAGSSSAQTGWTLGIY